MKEPALGVEEGDAKAFTAEETQRLLTAAASIGPDVEMIIALGLLGGLRIGEVLALQWRCFSAETRTLAIVGTNSHEQHREAFIATGQWPTVKTAAARRVMLCSSELTRLLLAYKLKSGNPPAEALLLTNKRGLPLDIRLFQSRTWKRLRLAAELPQSVTFHSLRHSYASRLLAAGTAPEFVQRQLGHRDLRTTLQTYRHWLPALDVQRVDAIDKALNVRAVEG